MTALLPARKKLCGNGLACKVFQNDPAFECAASGKNCYDSLIWVIYYIYCQCTVGAQVGICESV